MVGLKQFGATFADRFYWIPSQTTSLSNTCHAGRPTRCGRVSGRLHRLHEPVDGIHLVFNHEEKFHISQHRLFSEEMVTHAPIDLIQLSCLQVFCASAIGLRGENHRFLDFDQKSAAITQPLSYKILPK